MGARAGLVCEERDLLILCDCFAIASDSISLNNCYSCMDCNTQVCYGLEHEGELNSLRPVRSYSMNSLDLEYSNIFRPHAHY